MATCQKRSVQHVCSVQMAWLAGMDRIPQTTGISLEGYSVNTLSMVNDEGKGS